MIGNVKGSADGFDQIHSITFHSEKIPGGSCARHDGIFFLTATVLL